MAAGRLLEILTHVVTERAVGLLFGGSIGDIVHGVSLCPCRNQRLLGHEASDQRAGQGPGIKACRSKHRGDGVGNCAVSRILRGRGLAQGGVVYGRADGDGHE